MEKKNIFGDRERQLIQIVESGNVAMLRLALDGGASPLAVPPSGFGLSALMTAVYLGHEGCVREMISRGSSEERNGHRATTMAIAAQSSSENAWRCIKALIDSGSDPLEATDQGETPLMWSCASNNPLAEEIARNLLAWGGANKATLDGETSLMWAVKEEDQDWAPALLAAAGADPLMQENCDGTTALMMACGRGHHKAARAILAAFPESAAAMCAQANFEGVTALMAASDAGSEECARLVLPWSDAMAVDGAGNAALHSAHDWPVAEMLLAAGANIFQVNNKGKTPAEALSGTGSSECLRNLSVRAAVLTEARALAEATGSLAAAKKRPSTL